MKHVSVVLHTTFIASRKEPLSGMMDRVHQGFLDAGLDEPFVSFTFAETSVGAAVSSVDRVLKRHPELERFVTIASPIPGIPGARRISNGTTAAGEGGVLPYSAIRTIAAGVPRSFPFPQVAIQFQAPVFGTVAPGGARSADVLPGILITDSWWVNGRERSLSACMVVEGDTGSKKLPPLPETVTSLFAACGKIKKTIQIPLPGESAGPVPLVRSPVGTPVASAKPEAALAVQPIALDYRARMREIVERAALPHDLPPAAEAIRATGLGVATGPRKPALERAFQPLGYTSKSASGTIVLRRRTPSNLTVELYMDVGTWCHSIIAMFKVWGLGFKATLTLPVDRNEVVGTQYPIGNEETWRKIVANLAALVAELDRSFVPAIEAAAGPSPEWYQPES